MRYILVLASIFFSLICSGRDVVTICDSGDKAPIAGVSVISSNGMIIGTTDNSGRIAVADNDYPLAVRCLGYEAFMASGKSDTIFLAPASYSLAEVTTSPADRPITRVVTFAREYCTGSTPQDSMQMYSEYMLEYFFADGKVKGYDKSHAGAHRLARAGVARIANSQGLDSVFRPKYDDDIASLSFLQNMAFVRYDPFEETEAIKFGATADTVAGKYYPKYSYRKANNHFTVDCDALSDYKDHKYSPWFFKLLGMTMEMQEANWSLLYAANDTGKYGIYDFISGTYHIHVLGKGKQLRRLIGVKDAIGIDCYIEQYPVEIQRLTVDEYMEIKKEYFSRREPIRRPDGRQPLPPAINKLIDRANAAN